MADRENQSVLSDHSRSVSPNRENGSHSPVSAAKYASKNTSNANASRSPSPLRTSTDQMSHVQKSEIEKMKLLRTMYVGNLPPFMTEDDIRKLFEDHGVVDSVQLMKVSGTEESRRFAFVVMSTVEETEKAISSLNKTSHSSYTLIVEKTRPRDRRPQRRTDDRRGYNNNYRSNDRRDRNFDGRRDRYNDRPPAADYHGGAYRDRNFRDREDYNRRRSPSPRMSYDRRDYDRYAPPPVAAPYGYPPAAAPLPVYSDPYRAAPQSYYPPRDPGYDRRRRSRSRERYPPNIPSRSPPRYGTGVPTMPPHHATGQYPY